MLPRFSEIAEGIRFWIRLTPRGGRDRVEGWVDLPDGPVLKARVAAPPVDGHANAALIVLIAKTLGCPKSAVRIIAGETSRVKILEVTGDFETVRVALGQTPQ